MKAKKFILWIFALIFTLQSYSQSIATGYTVGTWSGFRTSAATFTFDDGCANQATATATLDEYGYKASFYPPTSWVSNWSVFQTRVNNGHEVGSHSVNHGNTMPDSEIQQSKSIINTNITGQDCNTITYPNCNEPSESVLKQHYIGGRICNGQVEGSTPSNYYQIGSLICGNQGSYNSLNSFQTAFNTAINKNGWAVFLIHEIDNGNGQANGYSPLSSSVFDDVVKYVSENDSKIWLTTFRNAILYSQERDKLSLTETTKSSTQYTLSASVSITSSVVTYDFPITVRRVMPTGWTNFAASQNGKDIAVKTITSGGKTYAQFDVVPGKTYTLEDRESEYTEEGEEEPEITSTNGISNGEFDSGTSGWAIQNNENAKGTMTAVTNANLSGQNAVSICPDGNSGTEAWHIQMYQNVTLKPNTTYSYSFMAKAASARNITVMVQKVAADYDTYIAQQYSLTTTSQKFSGSFTTPSDAAADSKIAFCIGGANGCVYVDNVVFNVPSSGGGGNSSHYETDACTHTTKLSGGTTLTQSSGGGHNIADNEFNYELWFDGSNGGASMTYFGGENDCAFKASWNNCGDYLARVGFYYGGSSTKTYKDYDNIHAEFNYKDSKTGNGGGSYSYIGVYGWTLVPNEIEFYIVDDSFTPSGGGMYYGSQVVGTYECDGATYTLRVGQRNNAPSISGTSTFKQIFAVRSTFRECGHISVSEHFKNWEKNGITLGNMYDCKLLCEVGGGTGSIEYTYATMYYGDPKEPEDPDNPDNPDNPVNPGTIEVSGDISKYFIDNAYVGPSCDALAGEEVNGGAYYTGEYTNLFVKYLGKTQAQVDEKMQNLWKHFFTVNGQNTVYYETNNNMAYIYDTGNQDVRTEGMSYGLMICVQMGDRDKFDKIWRWAKKYMQYKKGDSREGLFAWQCETNGNIKGSSCAPDGEMYFLTALWFASHRWGNDGDINYEEEAQYLANQILNKPGRAGGQVSPIFNFSNHIVTFGETSYQFTDPSYNLPGFLELWARWSDTNKDFWAQAPAAARTLLKKASHPTSGLFPDYSQFDGTPYKPDWAGYDTRQYKYDASRSAMNVGMDYNWFAADANQPAMMERLLKFFQSDNFQHGYFDWDGKNGSDYYNQAMHGSNGVAVFALKNNETLAKTYVQRLWDAQVPTGQWRYYNGMVYFLSMLHASGYFKIYKPMPEIITEKLSGPSPVVFNEVEYTKDTTFQTLVDCKIYDVTITIEASAAKYTVVFKDYNGDELKSEDVEEGESATAPTEPTRTGYTFKEWDTDFTNVTEDLIVTAVYEINTYTVTFVDYDETKLKEQTVEHGSAATAPTAPTRAGYTFDGWDIEFDNVTEDIVVKATYKQNDSGSKYEAENATITNGASVSSNGSASGGKYVRMQEGKLTFNVNVTNAGMYNVKIAYSLTEDYKAQFLTVNGSQVGTVAFNQSGTSNPTFASVDACVVLNAGANTVGLEKSWGYVDIDYIEISTYERTTFDIDEALVTPNPQPAAAEIYEFLKDNFGKKSISGVMTLDVLNNYDALPLTSQAEVSYIKTNTGKYPAIVGFDFMHSTGKNSTNDWQKAYTTAIIAMAKELWGKGGIPTFSWHWRDPNQNGDDFYTDKCNFNLTNAFTNSSCSSWNINSTEYKNIVKDIDVIAGYLQQLQCDGVSILWRPVHEASGAWFWWGSKGATAYKQLYKLIFDRLVNYHGLHNLIWVWNSDGTDADWYPGDEFVDIVGRDFYYGEGATYNHSSLVCDYEALAKQTDGKKIITLAENGAVPYPENMDNDGALWSWFMPWYGDYVTSDNHNKKSDWNTIMNDSRVITLDDMAGWDNRTKIYDTTTVGTLYSKYGFSITPSAEGDSENELTLKSKQDCDSTIVLFLHANAKDIVVYTVTFVDYDDFEISKQTVVEGKDATAPTEPTREGYTFSGWDKDFTNVTSDLIVKAQYTAKELADYTALNKAIADAEAIETERYTIATVEVLQSALTAAKAVDTNLFAESQSVIDDAAAALTAAIKSLVVQTFTVTFVDFDDSTIDEQTIKYGEDATAPTDPTREGYTFSGWDKEFTNVTSDLTVKAQYTEKGKADYTALNKAIADAEAIETERYTTATVEVLQSALTAAKAVDKNLYAESQSVVDAAATALNAAIQALAVKTFTVTFVDYDDTELAQQTVNYGEGATAPTDPTREGYTFSGWDKEFTNVTSNLTVKAQYTAKGMADYTVLNKAISDAEAIKTESYTAATVDALQTALTAAKAVDKNLFSEDQSVVDAAATALNAAIQALAVKTFTVTFVDFDDSEIDQQTIKYGEGATAPTNPTREGYTFSGWDKEFTNVTSDLTVKAQYTEKGKADYSALNKAIADAEAIKTESYTTATIDVLQTALTAAKAVDKNLFSEDQSVVDAAATALNAAIQALAVKTFTVTFVADGQIVSTQTVEYGKSAQTPVTPTKTGYNFVKWNGDYSTITTDVQVTAEFEIQTFVVAFVDWNGTELKSETVEYNSSATAPANPSREGYTFSGWDKAFTNVTTDLTVTAQYTAKGMADYTNLNKAIAQAESIETVQYTAETIAQLEIALQSAKAVDKNLFAESQAIVDAAVTQLQSALSALVKQTFIVEFVVDDETISSQTVEYGKSAKKPTNPTRVGYTFVQWDTDYTNVTEDLIINAEFEVKTFTVRFVDYDNSEISVQTIAYGEDAVAPKDPVREGYIFTKWSGTYTNITRNVTITASYTQKAKASYTALDKSIATATNMKESNYSTNSWSTLQQELSKAQALDRNLYVEDQSIVDDANIALQLAISNLEKLDRMTLASTISVANSLYSNAVEGYNKGQYPIGSKAEFMSAIDAARAEYDRVSTTQQTLNTATATLQAAIDNFKSLTITTDKSQLLMTINKANNAMKKADGNTGAGSGQYPQTAVSAFQAAIDEAQQVYETSTSQDMVDNQVIILNDAITAFLESVNPIVVSTEELEKLVAEANSLLNNSRVGDKPGQYPLLEYMSLFTASNTAKDIIAQQNPNEDEIQTQTKVLSDLIEVFKNSMIPLAVDDAEVDATSVYAVNHTIYIMYAKDVISVYDNNGHLMTRVDDVDGFDTNPYEITIQKDGIYYVVIGSESFAVIIK